EQHDVLAGDGQQVIQPGAPERLLDVIRKPAVVAEQHARDERAPLPPETGSRRAAKPAPQRVRGAAETAAPAERRPGVDLGPDVDARPAGPGALVEAVRRPARSLDGREQEDDGSLRRGSAERQLELDGLVERATVEAPDARELALSEGADARLTRDHRLHPP